MKRQLWSIGLAVVALAAIGMWVGCSSTDSPSEPAEDPGPGSTIAITPLNASIDQPFTGIELKWKSVNSENGDVTYDVFVGPTGSLVQVAADTSDTTYQVPGELLFDTEYRWRVVAKDNAGSTASTFRFLVRTCHGLAGRICDWAGTGVEAGGDMGAPPDETALSLPQDVCFDHSGNPYVIDWNNHRVLDLDANGNFRIVVGGEFGNAPDGQADQIGLNHSTHVSFALDGDLILAAWHNSILKRMDMTTRYIETICGDGSRSFGGDGGPASQALLDLPVTTLWDAQGNLWVSDQANMIIRKIDTSNIITTVVGTPMKAGFAGDGGPATAAELSFSREQSASPTGKICFDADDNLYIADTFNHCVRIVTRADGIINTIAGQGEVPGFAGDGDQATDALLREPRDVAVDAQGNLYIADSGNHCIRMVDTNGTISTVAGIGGSSQNGRDGVDGKIATEARLDTPFGVEIGPEGHLWIADTRNHLIRIVYQ